MCYLAWSRSNKAMINIENYSFIGIYFNYMYIAKGGTWNHQNLSFAWRMTPKTSASFAVDGMFNDRRISKLEVRRNGLQAFSSFSVVGIWYTTATRILIIVS